MSDIEDWIADYRTADLNFPQGTQALDQTGANSYNGVVNDIKAVCRQVSILRNYEPDWIAGTRDDVNLIELTVADSTAFVEEYPMGSYLLWDSDISSNANTGTGLISEYSITDATHIACTLTQMRDLNGDEVLILPVDTGYRARMCAYSQQKSPWRIFATDPPEPANPPTGNITKFQLRGQTHGAGKTAWIWLPWNFTVAGDFYRVSARPVAHGALKGNDVNELSPPSFIVRQVSKFGDHIILEAGAGPDEVNDDDEIWVEFQVDLYFTP